MLLLALDTATPAVTAAVHDGTAVLASATTVDVRRHGELLAPLVRRVLADADATPAELTDVAVGVGPGPFTGLRVGLVTARVMALATGARLTGCCSLDVIARAYAAARPSSELSLPGVARATARSDKSGFVVATDARRKEVYSAAYDATGRRVDGPAVERPAVLAARLAPGTVVVGRGGQLYADVLPWTDGPLDPDAAVLASAVVAATVELLGPEPLYLRRPDITPAGPPGRAS